MEHGSLQWVGGDAAIHHRRVCREALSRGSLVSPWPCGAAPA